MSLSSVYYSWLYLELTTPLPLPPLVFNDGAEQDILSLYGTIPVNHKGILRFVLIQSSQLNKPLFLFCRQHLQYSNSNLDYGKLSRFCTACFCHSY